MAPKLEDWEIKKYWEIFSGLKPQNNKLTGAQVQPVLKNSKLPDNQLSQIWDLADIDTDGSLDFEEFCICMRFIFDLVNGTIQSLPSSLPDWLVPSSKAHLIQAQRALAAGNTGGRLSSDSEDEDPQGVQFDWYISPTDKSTYEQIYNSAADRFGRITFESLEGLYATLGNVPDADARFAWNLVNPRSSETIDRDQTLVFLHILNQRESGRAMPRGVPASLRATFSKETPEYSLDSHQADIHQSQAPSPAGAQNTKQSFANSYLSRIGGSGINNTKGTDFSTTKDTDWEEVRLKRELADLESKIAALERDNDQKKQERSSGTKNNTLQVRRELEQLLKYKQQQLINDSKSVDLSDVQGDVETVEAQVQILEQYLEQKKAEVVDLQQQIAAARG